MENCAQLKKSWKPSLEKYVPGVVFALLVIQPVLDVISYWATEWEWTSLTTLFRFAMFAAVMLYAFLVSDKKGIYFIAAGIVGGYWILHMIGCLRSPTGYISIYSDLSNYLRLIHLPLFCLAFITFFKKNDKIPEYVQKAFFVNFVLLLHSVFLSYITGTQVYTYVAMSRGVMGWAAVHNSQSAIVAFIVPVVLYLAYKKFNKWQFYFTAFLGFAFLFFVGTKVDYYSISLIFLAMAVLMIITGEKRKVYYFVLIALAVLSLVCYKASVVYAVRDHHSELMGYKQDDVDKIIEMAEDDVEDVQEMHLDNNISWEIYDSLDTMTKHNIRGLYTKYMYNMVDRFGFERVFEKYDFSLVVSNLLDMRQQKRFFAEMEWEDSDLFTRCFGYEFSKLYQTSEKINPKTREAETTLVIYDLENDFPAVFYYSGYVGFALYILFLAYFALLILTAVVTRFKKTVTVENGAIALVFALAMGISQFSGNVLRRPNVSIYISVVLAYIYYQTAVKENVKLTDLFRWRRIKDKQ